MQSVAVDPTRVYSAYRQEVEGRGERGAYGRTAKKFFKPNGQSYTDEWVRQIVKRHEAEIDAADDLAYVPAPGEVEYREECTRLAAELGEKRAAEMANPVLDMPENMPTEPDPVPETPSETPSDCQSIMSASSSTPTPNDAERQAPERELAVFAREAPMATYMVVGTTAVDLLTGPLVWLWQHEYRNILLGILAGLLLVALL